MQDKMPLKRVYGPYTMLGLQWDRIHALIWWFIRSSRSPDQLQHAACGCLLGTVVVKLYGPYGVGPSRDPICRAALQFPYNIASQGV